MQISSPAVAHYAAIAGSVISRLGINPGGTILLLIGIIVFFIALSIVFSIASYIYGWIERKFIARAQSRHGPTYVGPFGSLQNLADLLKLVSKEWFIPDGADRLIFPFVIPLTIAIFVLALTFLPFSPGFIGIGASTGLLAVFVLLSFSPLLFFLAGWTSGNKFSSISAQRSVVLMASYEVPLFIIVVSVAMLAGGYGLNAIVSAQSARWFAISMPLGFILFLIVMVAELERQPFDLREADSELIAGWLTDVSAPFYALFLLLDYMRLFVGSLLVTLLFLGGWYPVIFVPFVTLIIKVTLVSFFIMLARVTFVRMRIDQAIRLGWMYLTPLAMLSMLVTFIIFIR